MKSRAFKKSFLFFALLLTFHFSSFGYAQDRPFDSASFGFAQDKQGQLLTLIAKADYPSLMKNDFIDEVDSGNGQVETYQSSNSSKGKNTSIRKVFISHFHWDSAKDYINFKKEKFGNTDQLLNYFRIIGLTIIMP